MKQSFSAATILIIIFLTAAAERSSAQTCRNPNKKTYHQSPPFCAPDGTRGKGIQVTVNGRQVAVPDDHCSCLPIALRYNNPGVLKTPRGGWNGQLRDARGNAVQDAKGHAVFESVEAGIAAWGEWIKRRIDRDKLKTAFQIMSLYAPPDDCVGSIGKPPDCPFGVNPTLEYAKKVSAAVSKQPHDELNLNGRTRSGRNSLYAVFTVIATFEIGSDFCNGSCLIDRQAFERSMDAVWQSVQ